MINFGPAEITHNGTDIGKTLGGVSITILFRENPLAASEPTVERIAYALNGTIKQYQISKLVKDTDVDLYDYGEIVFTTAYGTLTLYKAKIIVPTTVNFGVLSQNPFTCGLYGIPDNSGQLVDFN